MQDIFLFIHLTTLVFIAWNVLRADSLGFLWIRGRISLLDETLLQKYHRRLWVGLIIMIASGVTLFYPMREFLLSRPQFYLKMAFVFTLVVNACVIGYLQKTACTRTFASLSTKEKIPLFTSGAISSLSWIGAFVTAFFLVPEY